MENNKAIVAEYRIVKGSKDNVESEMNELSKEGWIYQGDISSCDTGNSVALFIVMIRYPELK